MTKPKLIVPKHIWDNKKAEKEYEIYNKKKGLLSEGVSKEEQKRWENKTRRRDPNQKKTRQRGEGREG